MSNKRKLTPAQALAAWDVPKVSSIELIGMIEEIVEEEEFIHTKMLMLRLGIKQQVAANLLRTMARQKLIYMNGRRVIDGEEYRTYIPYCKRPIQVSMIPGGDVARDWLVAAFFGDYKPCSTA